MDIYSLIENHVVAGMTPIVTLTSISTIAGTPTKYKLFSCDTYWISIGDKITIDGVVFTVVDFVQNEYLTVTGASLPVQLWFQISAPHFEFGSHRKVNVERDQLTDKTLVTPLVYMMPTKNTNDDDEYSPYGFTGSARVFFLTNFDRQDEVIDTQQTNVINPMRAMSKYFKYIVGERFDLFETLSGVGSFDWIDFGTPAVWGNEKRIFDEFLSGVELSFELSAFKLDYSCCASDLDSNCLPVTINGNADFMATAISGSIYNFFIKDSNGLSVGVWDNLTKTWTVPPAGGGGAIDINVNGIPFFVGVSTNQDVPVVDSTGITGVGSKVGANWQIEDAAVEITDSLGNLLYTKGVKAENSEIQAITDSTVFIKDSADVLLYAKNVKAQNSEIQNISDSTVNVKDSAGNLLHVKTVKAQNSADQTVADSTISNSDDSYSTTVLAEGNKELPDISLTINGVSQGNFPSVKNLSVSASNIIYIRPNNSIVTTSYVVGDYGWRLVNAPDVYTPPAFGIPALLDPTNVNKLLYNNVFGHKWRQTGINGGYYDTGLAGFYDVNGNVSTKVGVFGSGADSYMIDHHTGLGWKISVNVVGIFSALITNAHSLVCAGFSDFQMCSVAEFMTVFRMINQNNFLFPSNVEGEPFNVYNQSLKFCNNTPAAPTLNTFQYSSGQIVTTRLMASNDGYIPVRYHF